ncbi:hypothetical protein [Streptomyces sp. NBC_00059]|uniref:hypothetical protein n=1 Tax=Streptomyces sp. NBC_00059 TaxID=2975635 RepID=UPI00224D4748|nr:hypothetical protein [Streptomyces sp. NBC_00059]MCX5411270.1 hypothetical protein [Streptomyces sp. NBC_00059]
MGGIAGDATVIIGSPLDETVTERIIKPRLREGPYPADDVRVRLRGFVEPPGYTQCRKILDTHVLVLRAGTGTGGGTAGFALLAERYGTDGITGLDSPDDFSRWRPKEGRGYLLQGLSPAAAASLGEVALTALSTLLRQSHAHLVITVRGETTLPGSALPWQVVHRPPPPDAVAAKHLDAMIEAEELTPEQGAEALRHLASAEFADYLRARPLPLDGVEVAEGLQDLVVSGKSASAVLANLQTGFPEAAHKALSESRHHADSLSLMAAISLLPQQDRTVVAEFCATLRPLIDARVPKPAAPDTGTQSHRDVLGLAFEERLETVGARLLPRRTGAGQPYPVQEVVFSGRHRSDAVLRRLWLDYEDVAGLLWRALDIAPHHPGTELAAGQAIGKVLVNATGPNALRQLLPFATSERRWQRRLVAYALGEMAQHPALIGAVRDLLRQWSRAAGVPLRCTVAETCAGSYGLARPAVGLKLLDAVLDKPGQELDSRLRVAVSFALSTLLSEDANHTLVMSLLRKWQQADGDTQHHTLAVHAVESMSRATFPLPGAPGVRHIRLADLLAEHPAEAFSLVVTALNDPDTHTAAAKGLSLIESNPELRHRTAFPHLLAALTGTARSNRGVLRFVLHRHRARTDSPAEGFAS